MKNEKVDPEEGFPILAELARLGRSLRADVERMAPPPPGRTSPTRHRDGNEVVRGLQNIARLLCPSKPPAERTIRRWIRFKGLPAGRVGGSWMASRAQLKAWRDEKLSKPRRNTNE